MNKVPFIDLNSTTNTPILLSVGDRLTYTYSKHSSVGYEGDFKIEDESILTLRSDEITYHHPERLKDPQITGADAATGKFVFEVIKAGKTQLTIQELFRFEVEKEHIFELIIKD